MFSLIHSTFYMNEILEDGQLRSLAKMKNKEIKSQGMYETSPFVFTLLVLNKDILNIIKSFGGMGNCFVFDTSLLLNRKFTLNNGWYAGPESGTEGETYDGNKLTEEKLLHILQNYYNTLLEKRKKINRSISTMPQYYGEILFTHQIDLKRYLQKIILKRDFPLSKFEHIMIHKILMNITGYKKVEFSVIQK